MLRIFAFVGLMLGVAFNVEAQAQNSFWVESYNKYDSKNQKMSTQVDIFGEHKINERLKVFIWSLSSNSWGEGIVGLTYTPVSWIDLSLGGGVESDKNPLRMQASAYMSKGSHSLYLATELGGSGKWYLIEQNNSIVTRPDTSGGLNNVGIGVRAQRFAGVGPRIQVVFSKKRVMVWAVPVAIDPEVKGSLNSVLALRLSF